MTAVEFDAPLREHDSVGAWCFVTVPEELSDDLLLSGGPPTAFGSIRVEVGVGGSVWRTSVFPDRRSGCYVLPVRKAVRRAEHLEVGDPVRVRLQVVTGE